MADVLRQIVEDLKSLTEHLEKLDEASEKNGEGIAALSSVLSELMAQKRSGNSWRTFGLISLGVLTSFGILAIIGALSN